MQKEYAYQLAQEYLRAYEQDDCIVKFVDNLPGDTCAMMASDTREMTLSMLYLDNCDDLFNIDTVLHEVAHAVLPGYCREDAKHGHSWQAVAKLIGAVPLPPGRQPVLTTAPFQITCHLCGTLNFSFVRVARSRQPRCKGCQKVTHPYEDLSAKIFPADYLCNAKSYRLPSVVPMSELHKVIIPRPVLDADTKLPDTFEGLTDEEIESHIQLVYANARNALSNFNKGITFSISRESDDKPD